MWINAEMHPAVLEFARIIRGERGFLLPLYACHCREDTQTHQDLETVADPEDQFTIAQELAQGTLQAVAQLRGQDNPRCDVIAKREPSGNGQDVKTLELLWLRNEVAHVPMPLTSPPLVGKLKAWAVSYSQLMP